MTTLLTEILDFKPENTKALASTITNNVFHFEEFYQVAHDDGIKKQVPLPGYHFFILFI
jgi:hypothetical protein